LDPAGGGTRRARAMGGPGQNKGIRGGGLGDAAQGNPQIDAEIAENSHFWMETSYFPDGPSHLLMHNPASCGSLSSN